MTDTHKITRASGAVLNFPRSGLGLRVLLADGTIMNLVLTEI